MFKIIKSAIYIALAILFVLPANAQDTTKIQCFEFNDITKRRGKYLFPDGSDSYQKVLMAYTLKCDAQTQQDQYDCGEWDYLTYTYIYDDRGIVDSTYNSRMHFQINGKSPSKVKISNKPQYDYFKNYHVLASRITTNSLDTTIFSTSSQTTMNLFKNSAKSGRFQYIWKANELLNSGLDTGLISGLRLNFKSISGTIPNLRIKLKNTTDSIISTFNDNLSLVYYSNTNIAKSGWVDFQFMNDFMWDGNNLIVEFSFDSKVAGTDINVFGEMTKEISGIASVGEDYVINLAGDSYLNCGKFPTLSGRTEKTIEMWAKADVFNNAGIFQYGTTGAEGKDFSFRTTNTNNNWRAQFWGTPDLDVTLPNSYGQWHHYAVTYDKNTMKVYMDGALMKSKNFGLNTGDGDFMPGRWQGNRLNGMIDNIRLWDRALTDVELEELWHSPYNTSMISDSNLLANYSFPEGNGQLSSDISSKMAADANFVGSPSWNRIYADELFKDYLLYAERPQIIFEQGDYITQLDSTIVLDSLVRTSINVDVYDNDVHKKKIHDNSMNHPTEQTRTITGWRTYGYNYIYDRETGNLVDSLPTDVDQILYNRTLEWYSTLARFEIGRYITPYGIGGLPLVDDGFTWIFDVTDYLSILVDSVDISAGNQQELIDLQFWFIKGTPAREVVAINRIWGQSESVKYSALSDNSRMNATLVQLNENTESMKVKTRLTGHGHNSNTGSYPHCCEWLDNDHFLFANGSQVASWKIWQATECAQNPIYPQGGTWPGAREGWCPGDKVKEWEFDVTDRITGNSIALDYSITPVPSNNLGMGNGNYVMAMHAIQYGPANFTNDVEIYEIKAPNNWEYYSRFNPICSDAKIIIRNSGATELTSATIEYGLKGGIMETFEWTGSLEFMEMKEVILPIQKGDFWTSSSSQVFEVKVSNPNQTTDEYAGNNEMSSRFDLPVVYPETEDLIFVLRTNNNPSENELEITDMLGNVVHSRINLSANTTYFDTVKLKPGCYTMSIRDDVGDGLSYWANTAQGTGSLYIRTESTFYDFFEPEFGMELRHTFSIGNIVGVPNHTDKKESFLVYPNPSNGSISIDLYGYTGQVNIKILGIDGKQVYTNSLMAEEKSIINNLNFSELNSGLYLIYVEGNGEVKTEKIVIK